MASYLVTLQVYGDETQAPTGPVSSGIMKVEDPSDRKDFVTTFGWTGHALLEELKRQWQIICTLPEASASSPEPS